MAKIKDFTVMLSSGFNPFQDPPRRASELPAGAIGVLPHGQFNQIRGLLTGKELWVPGETEPYEQAIASYDRAGTVATLFRKTVESLGEKDCYFDSGCGHGNALKEMADRGVESWGITLTVSMYLSFDDMRKIDQLAKARLYCGNFFLFPTDELQGRVTLITDIHGVFRYGGNPAEVLRKFALILAQGGLVFIRYKAEQTIKVVGHELEEDSPEPTLWMWLQTVKGMDIVHPSCEDKEPGCCVLKRNDQPFSVEPLSGENAQRIAAVDLPPLTWQVGDLGSKILAPPR